MKRGKEGNVNTKEGGLVVSVALVLVKRESVEKGLKEAKGRTSAW